jgi:DNA-binding XRE family transcriptional regulator
MINLKPNLHRFFRFTCNGKYSDKDLDRLISKIDTTPGLGPKGECWEWIGSLDKDGYGTFSINKNSKSIYIKAHRAAYEIATNKLILDCQCVLHKCDNPKCVKAYLHLSIGTQKDNMKDMVNKRRQAHNSGEKCGTSKFTWLKINKIRELYTTGEYTQRQLAEIFVMSIANICQIVNNIIWHDSNYIPLIFKSKGNSKLTQDQADYIRIEHTTGEYTQRQLADKFNVSRRSINSIISNKIWCNSN